MNPVFLIYTALVIIGLIILWALVRCFFKRLRCCMSIHLLCRRHGLTLRARPLWWLGSRYLRGIDCLIEGKDTVFAVKLFGCLWPLKSLILRERGEYFFRAHSAFLTAVLDVWDGYPHTLPDYSQIFSAYGVQGERYVNWETSTELYTAEQYAEFAK